MGTTAKSPSKSKPNPITDFSDDDEENTETKQKQSLGEPKAKQKLKEQMEIIKKETMQLTERQRVKKELQAAGGKKARVTEEDVAKKMRENGMKNLTSNFTVTSRDRHQFIFRNKTGPPDVGKYNPNTALVEPTPMKANF